MYYTVKNVKAIREELATRTNSINNLIDNLFAGNEINTDVLDITPSDEPISLVRTRTYIKDSIRLNDNIVNAGSVVLALMNKISNPQEHYTTFKIPKRSGGLRTINAPDEELMKDMRTINNIFVHNMKILAHDSAWAYVKGRDVVSAMHEHTNNKSNWYLKTDLKDFFGSCSVDFIEHQLKEVYPYGLLENIFTGFCRTLAEYATLDGGLPQGTPLSPIITNSIMIPIDYKINKLLNELVAGGILPKQKYIYTRYADDIIISAKTEFNYELLISYIEDRIFKDTPLKFNKTKTRFATSSGRNWNLGVMCNRNNQTTIGYRKKNVIKVMAHNYYADKQNDITWGVEDLQHFQGILAWLEHVEPEYYQGFTSYLQQKYNYDLKESILQDLRLS